MLILLPKQTRVINLLHPATAARIKKTPEPQLILYYNFQEGIKLKFSVLNWFKNGQNRISDLSAKKILRRSEKLALWDQSVAWRSTSSSAEHESNHLLNARSLSSHQAGFRAQVRVWWYAIMFNREYQFEGTGWSININRSRQSYSQRKQEYA